MKRCAIPLIGLLLVSSAVIAQNRVDIQPRDWTINGQAMNQTMFTATFVKYEGGLVYLKLPNGFVQKVPAGQINDQGLWYIQSIISQVPERISTPDIKPDQKLLVDISAENMPLGPVTQWANKGALGGAFHALRTPLTVKEIDGRKAVNFYFGPWAVPLEFQAMISDFQAPKSLIDDGPYSVVTWVWSPSPLGIDSTRESVMSWHALDGDTGGTDFGYGTSGRHTKVERGGSGAYSGPLGSYPFPEEVFPRMNQWHHIAWVYSGPSEGKLRIYIDGKPAIEKDVNSSAAPSADKLMFLGCGWGGGRGGGGMRPQSFYTGAIADLKVYNEALDQTAVSKLYGNQTRPAPAEKPIDVYVESKPSTYFSAEFDGLVAEPFPKEIRQSGEYGKYMEGWGQPVIGRDRCPDEAMRRCAYTMAKCLKKRPDVVDVLESLDCAARLDDVGPPWLGFTEMTTACYGQARSFFADPGFYWGINIMVHEMGHQFHMWGAEQIENDFRDRLFDVFWQNKLDGLWSGDYGGLNMWEYMACAISALESDGTEDDVICRRELFRSYDPRMYYFLQPYWPGGTLIELLPYQAAKTDASGKIVNWDNNAGMEFWGKFALKKYPWTVGAFTPKGSPKMTTVKGVAAVAFGGKDALVWNKTTRECLIDNHEWSIELWAYRDKAATSDDVLVSWGPAGTGVRAVWGKSDVACDFGQGRVDKWVNNPSAGKWHHIVWVFVGGGIDNTQGAFKVYVDGKLDHTSSLKLDIPTGQAIVVGGALDGATVKSGFNGALAHVRIHEYDLGDLELKKHYAEEASYYNREPVNVAGSLLVDLDARQLATCPEYQFRSVYPKSTGRTWLRSWANRGTLGGKMSNDVTAPQSSYPHVKVVDGITAVTFGSKAESNEPNTHIDRIVASFAPNAQAAATFQAWVYRSAEDKGGAVFEWGNVTLDSKNLKPGKWNHVAVVRAEKGNTIYVDGKLAGSAKPAAGASDRLHIGAAWDGKKWVQPFTGAIAEFKVHSGALTTQQIAANIASSDLMLASQPVPAMGDRVVVDRKPTLSWNPGIRAGKDFDVYFSTDPAQVASGKALAGKFKSGAFAPKLGPGKTYYWRVDGLDASGKAAYRGPVWSFATYQGLLVDVDAGKLAEGKLAEWKNDGAAGGKFVKGTFGDMPAPRVATWSGRKGVSFFGNKYLTSTVATPKALTGKAPFSASIHVYNNELLQKAIMLSWGDAAKWPVEFIYGRGTDAGAFANGDLTLGYGGTVTAPDQGHYNAPLLTFWTNITYTYSGGDNGALRVYVNGLLNTEDKVTLNISDGGRISVGALVDANGYRQSPFAGFISDVAIYSYALSQDEIKSIYDGSGTKPNASQELVKLTSDSLPDGKLTAWKNQGTLGGEFTLLPENPTEPNVETVAGRKAVTFDGKDTFMASTIKTPASVTGINPVTVEMWVHNPNVGPNETVFSLAPREAFKTNYLEYTINRALEVRYCSGNEFDSGAINTNMDVRSMGWKNGKYPEAGQWHHIAFVYDGQHQGWGRVYVDGKPATERGYYTLCTNSGLPMFLGTAWNTDRGTQDMFTGSIASVKVYDYPKTADEIAKAAGER